MEHTPFLSLPLRDKVLLPLGLLFFFWMILAFPTGWIYDLGAGVGTEQGQMPDPSVSAVRIQADVEDAFFQSAPVTVSKDGLIQCPLMRLRDTDYAGEHTSSRKRTVVISEYGSIPYPISPLWKLISSCLWSGAYNGYYLAPLEDGSYVCVYFDDYLLLRPGETLPTGYVRYTTTEEKTMLHQMAEAYSVDPVYVLDMYRHGKVNWMLDFLLRVAAAALLWLVGLAAAKGIKRAFRRRSDG